MLPQIARFIAVLLVGFLLLPSCVHFTQAGRQQAAYSKYIRKQSAGRVRQQTKFKKTRVPRTPAPSQPKETIETKESPQSVTSGESGNQ
jgi:hypothetical protein